MSDKPKEDQPLAPSIGEQAPKQPAGNGALRPQPEKAEDGEGQTREPGYDEA